MLKHSQMNRLDALFEKKSAEVLSVYMTAGYPVLDDTVRVIKELCNNGVDKGARGLGTDFQTNVFHLLAVKMPWVSIDTHSSISRPPWKSRVSA